VRVMFARAATGNASRNAGLTHCGRCWRRPLHPAIHGWGDASAGQSTVSPPPLPKIGTHSQP